MSVYSGFSSRKHESLYGRLTEDLLSILTWRAMCALKGEEVDEDEWGLKFMSIHSQMARLEQRKYHPPKFSSICTDINTHFADRNKVFVQNRRPRFSITEEEVLGRSSRNYFRPVRKTPLKKPRDVSRRVFKPVGTHHRRRSQYEQQLSPQLELSIKFDQLKETVLKELFDYSKQQIYNK